MARLSMRTCVSLLAGSGGMWLLPLLVPYAEGFVSSYRGTTTTAAKCSFLPSVRSRACVHLSLGKEWYNSGDKNDSDDDDRDEDDIDLSDQDWRAFRAKLVMQPEQQTSEVDKEEDLDGIGAALSSSPFTPLDFSQWAYDSGRVIETGAVILGGVEQDFGFGLRQQYFHKTVILVLDHEEHKFTKGIILNRPTDMLLVDDDDIENDKERKWRVWFGGDVQGWDSSMPDIVCLHSLKGEEAEKRSTQVMKDIQYTSFDNAKELVQKGLASPSDFWVFCGYAGWGPQQLMGEIERKSWYMVATDSQTLLKELARQSADSDPRDAGLNTWELLMNMIGREDIAEDSCDSFDDLMLKEWAREKLLSDHQHGSSTTSDVTGILSTKELLQTDAIDRLIQRASAAARGEDVRAGSVVSATSTPTGRSPFLLSRQEFHKSLVAIISDDENISCGVILNQPAAKGLEVSIKDKVTGKEDIVIIPLRYGGEYAVKGQDPLLWLHCSSNLRKQNIGVPLGDMELQDGLWRCTAEDATSAIARDLAKTSDFMVISGVSVWTKGERGIARGIQGEIRKGNFEAVDRTHYQQMWDTLLTQDLLTTWSLANNLSIGKEAWEICRSTEGDGDDVEKEDVMDGIGEGYDEEDDSLVFKTDVKVNDLSDDALRSWVATFLLGSSIFGT